MFDWTQQVTTDIPGGSLFPLVNFAGKVYLTYHDDFLVRQLEIAPGDKVLDIGGGSRPFDRADVVTEAFPDRHVHRSGTAAATDGRFVQCLAEDLPFADRTFDFALARHVFEHVADPARACREMMRVAKRGYIETPGYCNSYLADYPAHRWIVYASGGKLIFEKKRYRFNPFRNALRGYYYLNSDHRFNMDYAYRNIACTQFYWEDGFQYEVLDSDDGFDYDDPDSAALAHLDFALNSLKYGPIPSTEILAEIEAAASYDPDLSLGRYFQETSQSRRFSQTNFAGKVVPLVPGYADQILQSLNTADPADVLEISSQQLIPGSQHFTDPDSLARPDRKFKTCIVMNVIENHPRPKTILERLPLLADGGIIEVPSRMWAYFEGNPQHLWQAKMNAETLVLSPKPFRNAPFPGVISQYCSAFPEIEQAFQVIYRNLTFIQYFWKHTVSFRMESGEHK